MNVAKGLLNRREEARGIRWFYFLCDISNSYLLSVGQGQLNCQTMLHTVFSGCMDPGRTGDCSTCLCSQATATGCLHHIFCVGKRGQAYPSL